MSIEFSVFDEQQVVLIEATGDVSADQVRDMRQRSVELVTETGYKNFIVDLRKLGSLVCGGLCDIYDLGNSFSDVGFTVWSNTAVLMPESETARKQAELLHTIEINRGRGVMDYVDTREEAFSWFEEMASRAYLHPAN